MRTGLRDCERVTERRNRPTPEPSAKFLHGEAVLYGRAGRTLPMPSAAELQQAANEILTVVFTLNGAQLQGFPHLAGGPYLDSLHDERMINL